MSQLISETHDSEIVKYSYDICGNHLEKVHKNGKEYTHNVNNQLVSKVSEKTETFYQYNLQGNILETEYENGKLRCIMNVGLVNHITYNGGIQWTI